MATPKSRGRIPAVALAAAVTLAALFAAPALANDLDLQPKVWNVNWEHSNGTVSALLRGPELDEIDLSSIVLIGTDGTALPLEPLRARLDGNHVRAFFAMSEAIDTLDTPQPGEVHEITIEFMQDGELQSLTFEIRVVGPGGPNGPDGPGPGGDLNLDIKSGVWNVNWEHSNGNVIAFIRGPNLADIDLDSIFLVGTDPAADPLEPFRVRRLRNHVRAFFHKSDAIATLDDPAPGEMHEVTILLDVDGVETELTDFVRIVGPAPAP
jgi:hypothetical protein